MMLDELVNSLNRITLQTKSNLCLLGIILLVPWIVFFVSRFINNSILLLGIIPRRIRGLSGVFLSPLLHANFNHIFFNSIPLVVLSNFILINGFAYYFIVTLLITIMSGLAIWCFAKPGLYVGASALITGYWGFLISNIYQTGTVTNVILGLISLYYFAGILTGIFPKEKGGAWEGHLLGLIAGFATSYLVSSFPNLVNFMVLP